jgi:hypothetical protein
VFHKAAIITKKEKKESIALLRTLMVINPEKRKTAGGLVDERWLLF